jgi:PAS domain S-box-containing protein
VARQEPLTNSRVTSGMITGANLLEALPVAVYTTDVDGRISFYNEAAAELWKNRPELGSFWCGSSRLFWPDGRPMRHDECPMAVTLRERRPVRGVEAIIERPDGTRVPFAPYPSLLKDPSGEVVGAINLLVDLSETKRAEIESSRLAAIVTSSDDAIISKTVDGRIASWNAGATHIFGCEAEEMIGQSIKRIIPPELHPEEDEILARIRHGERVDHYETVRLTKNGRRVDVSLTVSPLHDNRGQVVGASTIARDITERKQREELQRLLFYELNHRVKNMLAVIQAIATQSLQRATNPQHFVESFRGRIQSLARTHDLLVQGKMRGADVTDVVRQEVMLGSAREGQISVSGSPVTLGARTTTQLALVLHELATNARKFGALSLPAGRLSIRWKVKQTLHVFFLEWKESGVPQVRAPIARGFGTTLIERSLANGGGASMRYRSDGLICRIRLPLPILEPPRDLFDSATGTNHHESATSQQDHASNLQEKRILLIEDEPIIAMEIASQLESQGCEIIGPANSVDSAKRLIGNKSFDVALVDANLSGDSVDDLVVALTKKGVPFAFVTGYARHALPARFRDAPVLAKPFSSSGLFACVKKLL